jgi:hypothetical protein
VAALISWALPSSLAASASSQPGGSSNTPGGRGPRLVDVDRVAVRVEQRRPSYSVTQQRPSTLMS